MNCVFTLVQLLRINPRGRRQPKIWELLCQLVVFLKQWVCSRAENNDIYIYISSRLTALLSQVIHTFLFTNAMFNVNRGPTCGLLGTGIQNTWLSLFMARFNLSTQVVYLQSCLVVTWLSSVTWNYHRLGAFFVHHTTVCTMPRQFMQSHMRKVHACLAVV